MEAGRGDPKNAAIAERVADFIENCDAARQAAQRMIKRTHDLTAEHSFDLPAAV